MSNPSNESGMGIGRNWLTSVLVTLLLLPAVLVLLLTAYVYFKDVYPI